MNPTRSLKRQALGLLAGTLIAALALPAMAVPSFSRQTGQECVACHIGGYGPELTPMGMKFKLGAYADTDGKAGKVPLSAMLIASYKKDRDPEGPIHKTSLDEASIFLAGRMFDNAGAFLQVTHDGAEHKNELDHVDLRFASTLQVAGREALVGVSLNNAPTAQDPFNSTGVWTFPYTGAEMGVETVGLGVEGRVLGANAYAVLDDHLYGEIGFYNSLSPSFQSRLGLGREDAIEAGRLTGAPYWRLAYMEDLKTRAWSVGIMGFNGKLKDRETGDVSHKFNDFGIDANYQFLGNREHIVTLNASLLKERDNEFDDTLGDFVKLRTTKQKVAVSYFYQNTYGATVALINDKTRDPDGADVARQRGYLLQADWTPFGKEGSWMAPWANLRVGLQYANYDDVVADGVKMDKPHDKNRTTLFLWSSF